MSAHTNPHDLYPPAGHRPALPAAVHLRATPSTTSRAGTPMTGMNSNEPAAAPKPSRQTAQPLAPLRTTGGIWQITEYTDRIRRGEMLLDPPYQRGPAWNTGQRIDLMRPWLQGAPIPAIVLNERMQSAWRHTDSPPQANYAVVDGRQRLETAIAWQDGALAIPASWLPAD